MVARQTPVLQQRGCRGRHGAERHEKRLLDRLHPAQVPGGRPLAVRRRHVAGQGGRRLRRVAERRGDCQPAQALLHTPLQLALGQDQPRADQMARDKNPQPRRCHREGLECSLRHAAEFQQGQQRRLPRRPALIQGARVRPARGSLRQPRAGRTGETRLNHRQVQRADVRHRGRRPDGQRLPRPVRVGKGQRLYIQTGRSAAGENRCLVVADPRHRRPGFATERVCTEKRPLDVRAARPRAAALGQPSASRGHGAAV